MAGEQSEVARIRRDVYKGNTPQESIEDEGRPPFECRLTRPGLPPGANDIESLLPTPDQFGDDFRGVLEIGIHQNDGVASRMIEPGTQSELVPEVTTQEDDDHLRI